jgi:enoyl-CoA hydratase/carnithine racemase
LAHRIDSRLRRGGRSFVVGFAKADFYGALETSFEAATAAEEAGELACFRDPEVREQLRRFIERKKR